MSSPADFPPQLMSRRAEIWQVQIFGGSDDIIDPDAPTKFGTPMLYLTAEDEPADPETPDGPVVPLIYGPVGIHQRESYINLYSEGDPIEDAPGQFRIPHRIWREMEQVLTIRFGDFGDIEIEGLEKRRDGVAVFVRWEVEPFDSEDANDAEGEQT